MLILTIDNAVENTSKVAGLLSEYGPTVIILSIFLILFLSIVFILIQNNQKYMNQVVKQNDEIFKKLFDSLPKEGYDKEDIVAIFTKLNEIFKEECRKLSAKTDASRVGIYVFHNGTVASHGLPFFKMTCVSEWTKRGSGFTEQMQKHNNLNLALFGSLINELYDDGEYIVRERDCIKDPSTCLFLSDKGKTAIFTCVYDSSNRIMAFVSAEFNKELTDEEVEKTKNNMKYACAKIQPVLEFSSYNK